MVSFAELRDASPAKVVLAADAWARLARDMAALARQAVQEASGPIRGSGWQGPAASAAFDVLDRVDDEFELASLKVGNLSAVLRKAAADFGDVHRRLLAAIDEAVAAGCEVTAEGHVHAPRPTLLEWHDPDAQDLHRRKQIDASVLEDLIRSLVRRATDLDLEFALALRRFGPDYAGHMLPVEWGNAAADARGALELLGLSAADIPRPDGDPAHATAWWRGLSEDERGLYLTAHPREIGSLNGLPTDVRSQANKIAMRELLDDLRTQVRSGQFDAQQAVQTIMLADGLLQRLESAEYGTQNLYLLDFDPDGDGKAVVAVGNPDTAAHTAVLIPGVRTDLTDMDQLIDRANTTREAADVLTGPANDVAVIAWLGYDPPSGPATVFSPFGHESQAGAVALDQFVDGLRAAHEPGESHLTAIGHSYGSTVIGEASTHGNGLAVDDVVTLGSPGMRTERADDLNMGAQHVWAGAAANDHIARPDAHAFAWADPAVARFEDSVHGPSPHDPRFGANEFVVDTSGHGGYWQVGSETLKNQARIVVGHYGDVGLEHGIPPW